MFDRLQSVSATSHPPPPANPLDLLDALKEEHSALRALGALIGAADPPSFDRHLQFGLSKLIELCIDSQARILDSYLAQHEDSDACFMEWAASRMSLVEQGAFNPDSRQGELESALDRATVVMRRGGPLSAPAKVIATRILDLLNQGNTATTGRPGQGVAV